MKYHHKIALAVVAAAGVAAIVAHSGYPSGTLPDPSLTPGVTNPNVTQATINQTICVSGWTATIRPPASYTSALKVKQLPTGADPTGFEEDHLISLELGGSPTDPKNLWPEAYPLAHSKDQTENLLKKEICNGTITLAEAQREISTDWYAVYQGTLQGKLGGDAADLDDL